MSAFDPKLLKDLLRNLDSAAQNITSQKPANAVKDLDAFLRGVVKAFLDGQQDVSSDQALDFLFRSNQIEIALGLSAPADGVGDAEILLIYLRSDMQYYGVADAGGKLTQSLQNAMIALLADKRDQAIHNLQKFTADLVAVPMDPNLSSYFISYS